MAIVRFCRVQIIEGEESRLCDYYPGMITSAGALIYGDGVKIAVMPITSGDLEKVDPAVFKKVMQDMSELSTVKLEQV